ncbi:hypothetical protein EHE19_000345 [Ruminiclostridium herbifermentans]|uniref:Uncharacterized protein n=1 Tax=Ruminiclostridium herbifermentans TaxID=2488810 RepID=A0A7H1VNT2_9FIRM|nr:hypothetical protein [Ruminiclostridium herbifermentans]QNU67044.1 hypothetical protein EHE19_000345 [Ruminiclostridium herbifermentans]
MNVYEAPKSESLESAAQEAICGFNCNTGFGIGIVIAMIGPLPGPT